MLDTLLLYCRPGFEQDCVHEINALTGTDLGIHTESNSGFVLYPINERLKRKLTFDRLVFTRQWMFTRSDPDSLPDHDRASYIVDQAGMLCEHCSAISLTFPDSNVGRQLSGFCRRLQGLVISLAEQQGLLRIDKKTAPRVHCFFIAKNAAFIGLSEPGNDSSWPMGIPRLRIPAAAPSRAVAKLLEAWHVFLNPEHDSLRAGMRAVDLGAAPGGWSWLLMKHGLQVYAVDHGLLKGEVVNNPLVKHIRSDGFHYRPRTPVDWLVCDIADKPARIAELVARWLAEGWTRQAIFNLKLPMKKRYDEIKYCGDIIEASLRRARLRYHLRFKQLYHDRQEVTSYCRILRG